MPELPDVEGFRRVLEHASGRRIVDIDVRDPGVLRQVTPRRLAQSLVGRCFGMPRRHGKWLIAPVREPKARHRRDEPSLVFHFGMTGGLFWFDDDSDGERRHRHDRVVIVAEGGELRYRDMRKLQGLRLEASDAGVKELVDDLGPDAATIPYEELGRRLQRKRRQLKPALMDQTVVAGLGNLVVDEVIWRSRVHPTRATSDLSGADVRRVHQRMRTVLRQSVAVGRVPDRPSWLTGQRDEQNGVCPRCGTRLRHSRVAGRHSVWCPRCQPS
jgi:formamidopyrimidine-DNA glycosylase